MKNFEIIKSLRTLLLATFLLVIGFNSFAGFDPLFEKQVDKANRLASRFNTLEEKEEKLQKELDATTRAKQKTREEYLRLDGSNLPGGRGYRTAWNYYLPFDESYRRAEKKPSRKEISGKALIEMTKQFVDDPEALTNMSSRIPRHSVTPLQYRLASKILADGASKKAQDESKELLQKYEKVSVLETLKW